MWLGQYLMMKESVAGDPDFGGGPIGHGLQGDEQGLLLMNSTGRTKITKKRNL